MGGMDRRGIIDAVAEEPRDMAPYSQRVDDAFLLIGIDPREEVDSFHLCRQADIGEFGNFGTSQNAFMRQADGFGYMLHDGGLVARDDLELDPKCCQIGNRLCRIGLWRIGENAEANEGQVGLVGERQIRLVRWNGPNPDTDETKSLLVETPLLVFEPAPPGFIERMGQPIDLHRDCARQHRFRRALGDK